MTPFAVFGICFAIALSFFILPYFIFGSGITMLFIIFPAMAAQHLTGERGLDISRKSFFYTTLLLVFVLAQVVLLAAIFFGFYCLFFGYPYAPITAAPLAPALPAEYSTLLNINKILLFVLTYMACKFVYQTIRYREAYRNMNKKSIYVYQVLSFIMFLLAFMYLIACLNYFLDYPAHTTIGALPSIAGCVYIFYMVYSLIRMILFYTKSIFNKTPGITFRHMLPSLIPLAEGIFLLYFFIQMKHVLSVHASI